MKKDWMPENPYNPNSKSSFDCISHTAYDKGCQDTAKKVVELLYSIGFESYFTDMNGTKTSRFVIPWESWQQLKEDVGLNE